MEQTTPVNESNVVSARSFKIAEAICTLLCINNKGAAYMDDFQFEELLGHHIRFSYINGERLATLTLKLSEDPKHVSLVNSAINILIDCYGDRLKATLGQTHSTVVYTVK